MTDILCIVQARFDSSRFPGKVLADLAGYPIVEHVVTRCQATGLPVVVATTDREVDDPIAAWAVAAGVKLFRWDGKVGDVVGRFRACAEHHEADAIIRITADSPVISPDVIMSVKNHLLHGKDIVEMVSQWGVTPDGWEAQGCTIDHLRAIDADGSLTRYQREHVFPAIHRQLVGVANRWGGSLLPVEVPVCEQNDSWFLRQRFSIDTPADLDWLRKLSTHLDFTPPSPSPQDIYDLLRDNPELRNG